MSTRKGIPIVIPPVEPPKVAPKAPQQYPRRRLTSKEIASLKMRRAGTLRQAATIVESRRAGSEHHDCAHKVLSLTFGSLDEAKLWLGRVYCVGRDAIKETTVHLDLADPEVTALLLDYLSEE